MKISQDPKITVIMPVYNGEKYLKEAIESILLQTFIDFEFLIIDDGSNDKSSKIIEVYAKTDPRIRFLSNSSNLGLINTLNKGIVEAKANYIARMDADDIALPNRFEKQIQFLHKNSEISVLGTNMILINENSDFVRKISLPSEPLLIKWSLYFFCPLAHPTIMCRRSMLLEIAGYNHDFKYTEDYELWLRASEKYKFYNLSEALLYYRSHSSSVSNSFQKEQNEAFLSIATKYISNLIDQPVPTDVVAMLSFRTDTYNSEQSYAIIQDMYQKFIEKNIINDNKDRKKIRTEMYNRVIGIIRRDKNYNRVIQTFLKMMQANPLLMMYLLLVKLVSVNRIKKINYYLSVL
jgi:glycosyltransferase involved in cell wall biosynthesis